jgi:hypothetical protein
MQVNAQLLHQRYLELIAALPKERQSADNKESPPNGETLSGPPAAMELVDCETKPETHETPEKPSASQA